VPLRAVTGLLEASARLLADPESAVAFTATQVAMLEDIARRRLLQAARTTGAFQVRVFVSALAAVAKKVPIRDAALVRALVDAATGPQALSIAKRRGRTGAERLVCTLEDLVQIGESQRADGAEANASLGIDAVLRERMFDIVESAVAATDEEEVGEVSESTWRGGTWDAPLIGRLQTAIEELVGQN
jgi:hypothetical protein